MAMSSSEMAFRAEESVGGESSEATEPHPGSDQLRLFRGIKKARKERGCTAKDRISKMPPSTAGKRSSIYRGVTRHRWTGRYEAHLWDKSTWNESQNKKGKQELCSLGAYDDEEAAARAYDLAALKYWGSGTQINFPVKDYARDLGEMQNVTREDYLASLRRKSSGFSKGISKYRPFSRWDLSPLSSQAQGLDNINSGFYGDEMATVHEYAVGLSSDRKIDLSNYIKWWSPNGSIQSDVPSKALYDETELECPVDAASEIQALERSMQPTEPYEMPRLGFPLETIKHKRVSAMSALMKSAAYIRLKQKISKSSEKDESKSKPNIDKLELESSAAGQSCQADGSAYEVGGLDMQSTASPLASLLSAPFVMIDPISDPAVWSSLMPVLSPGSSSRSNNVIKTESTSDYTFF
ncbi:hypothetical protein M569_04723, partial [Genlisea aurea]